MEKEALSRGEELPSEARFDSNCITPGTPFMVRLQEQLKYFVVNKISQDELWKGVTVYLSGHEVSRSNVSSFLGLSNLIRLR